MKRRKLRWTALVATGRKEPMRRREFIGAVAAAATGITLGQVGLRRFLQGRTDPAPLGAANFGLSTQREVHSVCGGCAAGCSINLTIVDERLVGIRGNPLCPLCGGGLCARGASEVEAFYDPDRLLGPVQRENSRGKDQWKKISWNTGIEKISEQISVLAHKDRSSRIGFIGSSAQGATSAVIQRILSGLGSPHLYYVSSLRDEAAQPFSHMVFGTQPPHGYDLEHSDLVFSFGSPILDGWYSPALVARRFGQRRVRDSRQLHLIQIDSQLSTSAMHADQWVRCEPGTEPVLALGMAQVILNQGLADPSVVQRISGLASFSDESGIQHVGFKTILDKSYQPKSVSAVTGVSEQQIQRLVRRFVQAKAPLAVAERTAGSTGIFGLSAVNLLNALKDRFWKRGGIVFDKPPPLSPLQGPQDSQGTRLDGPPSVPFAGLNIWRTLSEMHRKGLRSPFDILFIEDGAALSDVVPGDPALQLLAAVPLTVSLATSLDRSSKVADLVLPTTSYYEQAIDIQLPISGAFSAVSAARAALSPLVDNRPAAELFIELGKRIGCCPSFTYTRLDEVVTHRLQGLVNSARGAPYGSIAGSSPTVDDSPSYLSDLSIDSILSAGGWIERFSDGQIYEPDHPYELNAWTLRCALPSTRLFNPPEGDEAWYPRMELLKAPKTSQFSLQLVPVPLSALMGSGTPNRPTLFQISSAQVQGVFRPWAEINPITAKEIGAGSTADVRISSEFGQTTLPLRFSARVRPNTVAVIWAPSANGYGRYAKHFQGGAELVVAGLAGIMGSRTITGLAVEVELVDGGSV